MTAQTISRLVLFLFVALAQFAATGTLLAENPQPAPVVVNNRTVVVLRASLLGYSPKERASAAARRIDDVLDRLGRDVVGVRKMSEGNLITLDDAGVFMVTPGDVDELSGDTLESVTQQAVDGLKLAVQEGHELHNLRRLLVAAGLTAIVTLIYLLVVRGCVVANRRLGAILSVAVQTNIEKLKVAGVAAVQPAHFLAVTRHLVALLAWAMGLFATYLWLTFSFERFPYTRPWGEHLTGFLLGTLAKIADAILSAVPGLVVVVLIFFIARFVLRAVRVFFDRIAAGQISLGWLDSDTVKPTTRIVTVVVWLFALAMAYPYLPGSNSDAFKGVSVLAGLMISIGASSLVGQAASGMILMYSRALKIGEYVKIGDSEGTVSEMGMFATRLATGKGEEVVLPNSYVVSNTTRNFSRSVHGKGFVLHTTVTIGYSTPWRQVNAMLLQAAERSRGILASPAPYVIQTALSDFYVEYCLVAYAGPEAPSKRAEAISELHANVQDVFNEHGVQIMSPHYMIDPAHPQVVPKERWYEAPASSPDNP
jgi:small-conductance mechanosensitive channel